MVVNEIRIRKKIKNIMGNIKRITKQNKTVKYLSNVLIVQHFTSGHDKHL